MREQALLKWGGITWLDWYHEFQPIPGLHQIVGHTVDICARAKFLDNQGKVTRRDFRVPTLIRDIPHLRSTRWQSMNFCLDVRLDQVALIDRDFMAIFPPRKNALEQLLKARS